MSKASRFLDTTIKVSELEHREQIYDQSIDEQIKLKEEMVAQEDFYDTVSEKKDENLQTKTTGKPVTTETDLDSEIDVSDANKTLRRRKTRKE